MLNYLKRLLGFGERTVTDIVSSIEKMKADLLAHSEFHQDKHDAALEAATKSKLEFTKALQVHDKLKALIDG